VTWGLVACVAGLVVSVIVWALVHQEGNYSYVSGGKTGVLVAAGGALLIGGRTRSSPSSPVSGRRSDVPGCVPLGALPGISIDQCSNPLDCIGQTVTASASNSILGGLGSMFLQGAEQMATAAFASLDESVAIDLSVSWLRGNVAVIAAITLPLIVGLLVVQVIGSVLRREPGGLVRSVVGVGKALVGATLALTVTQVALTAVDGACQFIAASAGTTVGEAAARRATVPMNYFDADSPVVRPAPPGGDPSGSVTQVAALLRHAGSDFEWVDPRFGVPAREHFAGEPVASFLATTQ
jgi:hypothetical protein